MLQARSRQQSTIGHPETSQLLLIVSDGRGLWTNEGVEVVKSAVRKTRFANVFLVFVIIDNPQNKVGALVRCISEFIPAEICLFRKDQEMFELHVCQLRLIERAQLIQKHDYMPTYLLK